MRTYDIALKYLKEIDMTDLDVFQRNVIKGQRVIPQKEADVIAKTQTALEIYRADQDNYIGNDYYKDCVFAICICNLADKAHKLEGCFDAACRIIEENRQEIIKYRPAQNQPTYPQFLIDKWNAYCSSIVYPPIHLRKESEIRMEILFSAYHYILG